MAALGSSRAVAQATGLGSAALAAMNLLFGAGCYGVAFAFLSRQKGLRRNFYVYTSLGLILVLVSTAIPLPFELRAVWHHASLLHVSILAINVGIIVYLARQLARTGHHPADLPSSDDRTGAERSL